MGFLRLSLTRSVIPLKVNAARLRLVSTGILPSLSPPDLLSLSALLSHYLASTSAFSCILSAVSWRSSKRFTPSIKHELQCQNNTRFSYLLFFEWLFLGGKAGGRPENPCDGPRGSGAINPRRQQTPIRRASEQCEYSP